MLKFLGGTGFPGSKTVNQNLEFNDSLCINFENIYIIYIYLLSIQQHAFGPQEARKQRKNMMVSIGFSSPTATGYGLLSLQETNLDQMRSSSSSSSPRPSRVAKGP